MLWQLHGTGYHLTLYLSNSSLAWFHALNEQTM